MKLLLRAHSASAKQKKHLFIFVFATIFCLCASTPTSAQTKDFGLWMGGSFNYKASKKVDLSLSPELRWDENVSRWRNRILDLGLDYDLPNGYKAGVTYRLSGVQRNSGWQQRQRLQLGGSKTWKANDWRLTWQPRIQFAFDKANESRDADQNSNLRNKFRAEYKGLNDTDVGSSYEFFHGLNAGEVLEWQNWRWTLYAQYKVSKDLNVSLSYIVDHTFRRAIDHRDRILALGFGYDLN